MSESREQVARRWIAISRQREWRAAENKLVRAIQEYQATAARQERDPLKDALVRDVMEHIALTSDYPQKRAAALAKGSRR